MAESEAALGPGAPTAPAWSVEDSDLTAYVGPRAERYLKTYDKMRSRSTGRKRLRGVISWNWGASLTTYVWCFYRKQYLAGVCVMLAPIVVAVLLPEATTGAFFGMMGALGAGANSAYVGRAIKRIGKADKLGLTDEARSTYLRKAGGVSRVAGVIAAIVFIALNALSLVAAISRLPAEAAG